MTCMHAWIPTIVHFIDIFVAKSQFYQIWKLLLTRAQEYPDMEDWMNEHKDRLSNKELWNLDAKLTLTFADLKKWLDEKDREVDIKQKDRKGKKRAVQSPPKPKKHDERDRAVMQRKHKKSMTSSRESE